MVDGTQERAQRVPTRRDNGEDAPPHAFGCESGCEPRKQAGDDERRLAAPQGPDDEDHWALSDSFKQRLQRILAAQELCRIRLLEGAEALVGIWPVAEARSVVTVEFRQLCRCERCRILVPHGHQRRRPIVEDVLRRFPFIRGAKQCSGCLRSLQEVSNFRRELLQLIAGRCSPQQPRMLVAQGEKGFEGRIRFTKWRLAISHSGPRSGVNSAAFRFPGFRRTTP